MIARRCLYCRSPLVDGARESGWTGKGRDWMTPDGDFGCDESPVTSEDGAGGHDPDVLLTRERNLVRVKLLEIIRPWKGSAT